MAGTTAINKDRAFFIATVAVLALSSLYYFLFQAPTDPARCKALLNDGFWLNPSELSNWQPAGCMLHTYRATEATSCLHDRRVVFIGGGSTRALFESTARKLDPEYRPTSYGREANQFATVSNVRFEFVWDPFLESTQLNEIRAGFENSRARPAMTVLGIGHDYIRQHRDSETWAAHVGEIVSGFNGNVAARSRQSDAIVLAPVLEPDYNTLPAADRDIITAERAEKMNEILQGLAQRHNVDVAFAFNKIAKGPNAMVEGLSPVAAATDVMADLLLNLRCNSLLEKHYYYDKTCCNTYPRVNWIQVVAFTFACLMVPAAFYLSTHGYTPDSSTFLQFMPAAKYHQPIAIMGFTVFLCWYFDRTNVFGKEQKQTSPPQFFWIMAAIIGASFKTMKTSDKDLPFLNRDQTDEWKGWMQIAILVYHYVGVSKTMYIYNYMRVMPTSYLFMTGFGHTVYFLKKDDFSFKRVVATMLRLNLLNVLIAYAVGNDWLLYYFAPLVTWNFFVIFTLLYVGHKHNKNMKFLFAKMVAFGLLNAAFCRTPGVMEAVFSVLQTVLRMEGNLREWRFRVTLDQYSVFPGMIAAILFNNWDTYSLPKKTYWPKIHRSIVIASGVIFFGYAWFEASQISKVAYNQWHTYVAWLPCCAFVVLRNATPWLRNSNNGFFAWAGRGSLETFLLQFHLWLAADTAGLLVIGPTHQRALNAIIMTPIFLYVSSLCTTATGGTIEWIMGAQPKPARPALPTTRSHPANIPTQAQAAETEKSSLAAMKESNGNINSALPINGQPIDVKIAQEVPGNKSLLAIAGSDLRIRVALILAAMAFLNWTYNL